MAKIWTGLGLAVAVAAVTLSAVPASAEFFGCNDKGGKVVASYVGKPGDYRAHASRSSARYTHEFAAQTTRPRITIQPRTTSPGPNAKRYCRSWLAKEYRVSGTVIVPKMECWWQ
ncbi:hypothetical protein MXD81_31130 [Microbacteriaceae bacterium K1510]|nr:hypothetical protein [Microbacteriaceae bacterium K1510]